MNTLTLTEKQLKDLDFFLLTWKSGLEGESKARLEARAWDLYKALFPFEVV